MPLNVGTDDYRLEKAPDAVDGVAFNVRQKRRKETAQILQDILCQQCRPQQKPKAVRIAFVLESERKSLDCSSGQVSRLGFI
jgi:hypothetical protein